MTISRSIQGFHGGSLAIQRGGGNFDVEGQGPNGGSIDAKRTVDENGASKFKLHAQGPNGGSIHARRTVDEDGASKFRLVWLRLWCLMNPTPSPMRSCGV